MRISKLLVLQFSLIVFPRPPTQIGLTVPGCAAPISYDARHHSPSSVPPHASHGAGRTQNGRVLLASAAHVTTPVQQHPIEDTLRKQVHYKPKRQAQHKCGPKRAGPNPGTKAHTVMTQYLTIDTANTFLQLLPRLSPENQRVAYLLAVYRTPPPNLSAHGDSGPGPMYTMHGVAYTH